MNIGKQIRINRLFAHPSKRLCSVAVDHFLMYGLGLPDGLKHIGRTLAAVAEARPDAVTIHKGVAASAWLPYAGVIPLIIQSSYVHLEDYSCEVAVTPEEAIRLGADALALVAYVKGRDEVKYLRMAADTVRAAERFDLPVICHIYPRLEKDNQFTISFEAEDIAWAAHCALETGVDVIKVPYCGDVGAYSQIIADIPVPVVAAGGPKQSTFIAALEMISQVIHSGARGATIGRNIWGEKNITAAVKAFKAVIHEDKNAEEAYRQAGF
jgi:class I fructose-bisphosphate aldolase